MSGIPEAGSGAVKLPRLDGLVSGGDAAVTGALAPVVVQFCVASIVVANPSAAVDAAAKLFYLLPFP